MSAEKASPPRTFYLNEQHELSRGEKEGGGAIPKYIEINWAAKGTAISRSLRQVRQRLQGSHDPAVENHYFLLAAPVTELAKASKDKKKAEDGKLVEATDFAEGHSRVFRRLGLDLLTVADDGSAIVHMKPATMDRLSNTAQALHEMGDREKSRWATIDRFGLIPPELRIDFEWVQALEAGRATDAVIEFQPLLARAEIDSLIRAIVSGLLRGGGEALTGTGADFSGRQWVRGKVTPQSLRDISNAFSSVQSIHSPLISLAADAAAPIQRGRAAVPTEADTSSLPAIGVLDTGVPSEHRILGKYRRGGYAARTSGPSSANQHGCFVSSRIVFGDLDYDDGPPSTTPAGSACYYDMNVSGINRGEIEDKEVYPALQAVVRTAPDVRVFNMSFDSREQLDQMGDVKRREALGLVQDLDNFIFQNDIVVVVAAGNSREGTQPPVPYPAHFDTPEWALGPWARSFNSLTCGSFVTRLSPSALVKNVGWPSPFCRVGPGLCSSPKPDFSAAGGNCTPAYRFAVGLGVWCLSSAGRWEDRPGTSFAAPLLARECAFALQRLQSVCEQGAYPFSVSVKAFLALTAEPSTSDEAVGELAERTLGRGEASAQRLAKPSAATGVMIWQGVLEDEKDIAKIQVPVPSGWLEEADEPCLRLMVAWDPPVNAAVAHRWSTRDVTAKLRIHTGAPALRPSRKVKPRGSYPFLERLYDLRRVPKGYDAEGDSWLVEISYAQTAEYVSAMDFSPQQRVAFAAELFDRGAKRLSPQSGLQSLPAAQTMNRLTVPPSAARVPVVLRTTA